MILAKLLGSRVYYAGIGADNHNKPYTKLCMLVATIISNTIYARDYDSIKALKKINPFAAKKIIKTPDLAYASNVGASNKNKGNDKDRYLIFCPRNLEQYKSLPYDTNRKLIEVASRTANELGLRKIIVLNADPIVDQHTSNQAAHYFQSSGFESEIINGDDLEKCSYSLSNCEFLLTIRLHPAVIALENSIPFAIFNYSEKNRKFAEESDTLERLIHQDGIDNFRPLYTLAKRSPKKCMRAETIQHIRKLSPGSN
ncbi:Polysaccharide pyruvyl transferase [compost metagenome]